MSADLNINVNVRGAESIEDARRKTDQAKAAASDWRQTITAVSSAYTAVRSAISDVIAVARGTAAIVVAVDEHHRALTRLGGAYELVQRETRGVVSAEQAVRVQQSLTEAGYRVTGEQLAAITRRAREYAQATGGEVPQAIDQMVDALRSGAAEGLGRFGIAVQQGQTRQASFRQATEQLIATQRGVAPSAHTAGEALTAFSTVARDAGLSIARDIGRSIGYVESRFIQLRRLMRELADMRDTEQANARGQVRDQEAELRMQGRLANVRTLSGAGLSGDQISRLSIADRQRVAFAVRGGASLQSALAAFPQMRAQDEANLERQRIGGLENRALDEAFAPGGQPQSTTSAGGGGGGGGTNPLANLNASIARVFAAQARIAPFTGPSGPGADTSRYPGEPDAEYATRIANLAQTLEDSAGQYEQQSRSYWQRVASNRQFSEQHDAAVSGAQRELASANSAAAEQRGLMGRVGRLGAIEQGDLAAQIRNGARLTDETVRNAERMSDAAYQMGAAFTDVFGRSQTLAQGTAGLFRTAMGSMTQSFRSHIGALITGRETIGEALKGMLHETLLSLAQESAVRAIMETAHGIAAVATFRYPQAAAHFAAAGVYTGVAVAAGVGAAITAPPQASASAGSSMGSDAGTRLGPSRAANDNAGGGNQTYVLNFQSALITREDAQDVVVRAAQGAFNRNARIEQISQLQRARAAA